MLKLRIKIRQANYPLLVLLLAGLLLTACGSDEATSTNPTIAPTQTSTTNPPPPNTPTLLPPPTPTSTPQPNEWQTRWLKGIPCKAPCWEGITPGQTSVNEAANILNNSPLTFIAELHPPTVGISQGTVRWTWKDLSLTGNGGEAYYSSKTDKVTRIRPYYKTPFKLSEIIKVFGEPSQILAFVIKSPDAPTLNYFITLFWLNYGLEVSIMTGYKPLLDSSRVVENPIFFLPTPETLEAAYLNYYKLFVPWQGSKDFDFYCRDPYGKNGEDCSKTLGLQKTP